MQLNYLEVYSCYNIYSDTLLEPLSILTSCLPPYSIGKKEKKIVFTLQNHFSWVATKVHIKSEAQLHLFSLTSHHLWKKKNPQFSLLISTPPRNQFPIWDIKKETERERFPQILFLKLALPKSKISRGIYQKR